MTRDQFEHVVQNVVDAKLNPVKVGRFERALFVLLLVFAAISFVASFCTLLFSF
jgi:hypothetical protein